MTDNNIPGDNDDASVDEEHMKALLEKYENDNDATGDDDSDDDDDEDSVEPEREVDIQDNIVDHAVLACGDLDHGIQEFERITGCSAIVTETSPAYVVKGLGIRCARVGFDTTYLEIIAPDTKSAGPIGALIKQRGITDLTLFHYAIRCNLDSVEQYAQESGYVTDRISLFGGNTRAGEPRKWDVVFLYGHELAGMCPFFIHWRQPVFHPCTYLTVNGSNWGNLAITAPAGDALHSLLQKIGKVQGFTLQTGKPSMTFSFTCPEGPVSFTSSSAVGFKFPGFEDDDEMAANHGTKVDNVDFEAPETPTLLDVSDTLPPTIESSS
jgi:Glyoxalase-like domain